VNVRKHPQDAQDNVSLVYVRLQIKICLQKTQNLVMVNEDFDFVRPENNVCFGTFSRW